MISETRERWNMQVVRGPDNSISIVAHPRCADETASHTIDHERNNDCTGVNTVDQPGTLIRTVRSKTETSNRAEKPVRERCRGIAE